LAEPHRQVATLGATGDALDDRRGWRLGFPVVARAGTGEHRGGEELEEDTVEKLGHQAAATEAANRRPGQRAGAASGGRGGERGRGSEQEMGNRGDEESFFFSAGMRSRQVLFFQVLLPLKAE
jgi:hypothetical protein